jgi:hypothetical protein
MIAYVMMILAPKAIKNAMKALKDVSKPILGEPAPVFGEADIVVKIKVADIKELAEFLKSCERLDGLVKTNTAVSLTPVENPNTGPVDAYVLSSGSPGILDISSFKSLGDIGVVETHSITGIFDALCEVIVRPRPSIRSVAAVAAQIRALPGVLGTASLLCIKDEDVLEGL